jgi:hypothetical protein
MEEIKTLSNCSDREFLQQCNKIRKSVAKWLTVTEIQKIRSKVPELEKIPENAGQEKTEEILKQNKERIQKQGRENLNLILDAVLEDHPDETLEVIRLCCFVDPKDDSVGIRHYMIAFTEMLSDEAVLNFFLSLRNMAKSFGLTL